MIQTKYDVILESVDLDDIFNDTDVITSPNDIIDTDISLHKQDRHQIYKKSSEYDKFFNDRIIRPNDRALEEWESLLIDSINSMNPFETPKFIKVNSLDNLKGILKRSMKYFGDGNYNWIDISSLTSLTSLFALAPSFSGDISAWDVSNIVNMNYTFNGCKSFNCDLSNWDTKNVKFMSSIFKNSCITREQFKSWNWNIKSVITKYNMF